MYAISHTVTFVVVSLTSLKRIKRTKPPLFAKLATCVLPYTTYALSTTVATSFHVLPFADVWSCTSLNPAPYRILKYKTDYGKPQNPLYLQDMWT